MRLPWRRWRILLAEDESTVENVVARSLREAGHQVTAVGDGWSAWREAQNQQFDLIITDQVMPHMNGADALGGCFLGNSRAPRELLAQCQSLHG